MAALEVLTNEGTHALNTAAVVGPRLVVEFACVGSKDDFGTETAEAYAKLKASDVPSWCSAEGDTSCTLPCVAMLPSQVTYDASGESAEAAEEAAQLEPHNAIDVEFSWLPTVEKEFDAIAVFARLYYSYTEYAVGTYAEGQLVWFRSGGTTSYFRCIAPVTVTNADVSPATDGTHWATAQLTDKAIGQNPPMRAVSGTSSLILLHISSTEQPIKVAQGLEFNYKLRIFLTNEALDFTDKDTCPVYLESLVPAGQAALQLGFLKEMSEAMASMRQVIVAQYAK